MFCRLHDRSRIGVERLLLVELFADERDPCHTTRVALAEGLAFPGAKGRGTWGSRGRHLPGRVRCWLPRCSRAPYRRRRRRSGCARSSKEADAVLAQVNALNQSLEASVEAWNGARYELDATRRQLVVDRRHLHAAERQRRVAIANVAARLRSLYESGDDDQSTLGILLGSSSVSEILDRLDAAHTVAAADKRLTERATVARNRYARAERAAAGRRASPNDCARPARPRA